MADLKNIYQQWSQGQLPAECFNRIDEFVGVVCLYNGGEPDEVRAFLLNQSWFPKPPDYKT